MVHFYFTSKHSSVAKVEEFVSSLESASMTCSFSLSVQIRCGEVIGGAKGEGGELRGEAM